MQTRNVGVATVVAAMMCALMPSAIVAQNAPAEPKVVTRTYSIVDMMRAPSDYPLEAKGSNGEQTGPTRNERVDSLVRLIQDTVSSDSWRDNGGELGSIREMGGTLIVTQTAENHRLLADLLQQLREDPAASSMLCVRAYWLTLDAQDVVAVFKARKAGNTGVAGEFPVIPDTLLDKSHLYCQAQTICFNGQTVHIRSGRDVPFVSDLTPIVGTQAVGYDPSMGMARSGVTLQVTPQLITASQAVVVDLHSAVEESSIIGADQPVSPTTGPSVMPGGVKGIDRLSSVAQRFQTTVRVPISKRVLIGGMTVEPSGNEGAGKQLYLAIEVDAVK